MNPVYFLIGIVMFGATMLAIITRNYAIGVFLFMVIMGLLYQVMRAGSARRSTASAENRQFEQWLVSSLQQLNQPSPLPRESTIYTHAIKAVRAAGLDPDYAKALVVDLGLIAFRAEDEPFPYRTYPIPDEVDYVQPFAMVRVPREVHGQIRFRIFDGDGELWFDRTDLHQLERGRNLITPKTRLPVHDGQTIDGEWQLKISAGDTLLAVHTFRWTDTANIREKIAEDGEISNELRSMIVESRLPNLSLDELLAHQSSDPPLESQIL